MITCELLFMSSDAADLVEQQRIAAARAERRAQRNSTRGARSSHQESAEESEASHGESSDEDDGMKDMLHT